MARRIWVIRHGDRFDLDVGKEVWERVGQRQYDPVLSDLGRQQAEQTASTLAAVCAAAGEPITKVITSPFVRCIQTADPIAGKFGLELNLDDSLFEVVYTTESFPTLAERAQYFPRINLQYTSGPRPEPGESFPHDAMARYGRSALALSQQFPGENIVLVTHAAGVSAIVASLCGTTVREVGPVHPASIYCLVQKAPGGESSSSGAATYTLCPKWRGAIDHFQQALGRTLPWPRESDGGDDWGTQWLREGEAAPWLVAPAPGDDKLK